jgi:hypothetical protein
LSEQLPKRSSPGQRQSSPKPQGKCAEELHDSFSTEEFLAEIRSLTPTERERLIRSYAR